MILQDKRIANIQLTERDIQILLFLLDTRFLSREQIERLFFQNDKSSKETTTRKANKRLSKLTENGLLERLYKPVTVGKSPAVYSIGKQGYQLLSKVLEQDKRNLVFKKKANKVEFLFLEHNLGIAEFRVCLELALRNNPEIDLLFWRRESKELNDRVLDPRKRKYLPVTPDAFFGLQTNLGRSYFFLEVDMATQEHRRITRKIIAYREYWKKGLYGQKYGFNSFRVLFVTTTERRLNNLLKTAEKTGAKNMFLFATQSDITEGRIFDSIWMSPATENISII